MDAERPKTTVSSVALSNAVIAALQNGNKIEAIKIVREERSTGLKEAKDVVENYLKMHPDLQSSFASARSSRKRRALLWLLVFIVALLVYQLVRKL
jgi:t-SNARE complex subunit (syntaxin)